MKRIHFFEFGDKNWVPKFLRDFETDFLEFGAQQFDIYKDSYELIKGGLNKASVKQIVDMGSGGGGGWKKILTDFNKQKLDYKLLLTDINPNIDALQLIKNEFPKHVDYKAEPVDATNVQSSIKGFRKMFLSFHHLKPKSAKQVLQNAVDSGEPIGIFELQDRTIASLLMMFIGAPINAIITAPFIRPFKLSRIFFTFLIPILPFIIWFDGVVSNLRTYNEKELKALTEELKNGDGYNWEIGKKKNGPGFLLYLIGSKK